MKTTQISVMIGVLVLLALCAGWARADAVANFDDGNTAAAPDGYAGMAGAGWAGPWTTSTSGAGFAPGTPTVLAAGELSPGGGNHLSVNVNVTGGNGQAAVGREIDGVDLSQPHIVRFQIRPEDLSDFDEGNDRYQAYDRAGGVRHGTDNQCTWMLLGQGGDFGGADVDGRWVAYDGDRDSGGFTGANMVSTEVPIVANAVYDVEVTVYPESKSWDLHLTDGTNSATLEWLGFRKDTTVAGGFLNFGGRGNNSSDTRLFSVDTVSVTQLVPVRIEANFTGGNGTALVDQYLGRPGKGWVGDWSPVGPLSATVTDVAPLGGGGPYLQVQDTGNDADRDVRRRYEQYGQIDPALPHRISWKWRFDGELPASPDFDSRVHFFGDDTAETGTGAGNSWIIGWISAGRPGNDVHEGKWYFFDAQSGNAFNAGNMVNTGFDLIPGEVYEFAVDVYPGQAMYDASIFSASQGLFTAEGLTFRNQTPGQYTLLHFGGKSTDGWALDFSVDSVHITAIPEPATMALLGLAACGLGGYVRRRGTA